MNSTVAVAWYRTRAQFSQRRGGYIVIVVLLALVGGLAMASVAGARRTESAFPRYLARSDASDVNVSIGDGPGNTTAAYSPLLLHKINDLPDVRRAEVSSFFLLAPLKANGAPNLSVIDALGTIGSIDGLLFNQDRVVVLSGRLANPTKENELMVDPGTAHLLGLHLGQSIEVGAYSGAQTQDPAFGTPRVQPELRVDAKLVGIVSLADQVVQDDVDRTTDFSIFTPAFTDKTLGITSGVTYGVQLKGGADDVSHFEQEFSQLLPAGSFFQFHLTAAVEAKVQKAIRPEVIALFVFGLIAALAALLIGLQAIGRQLRARDDELRVLRALGTSPLSVMLDSLGGVVVAIGVGSVLAVVVALALSPLAPIGAVRAADPSPGIRPDWTVLGLGFLILVGLLVAGAVAVAFRAAPHRAGDDDTPPPSRIVRFAAAAGLSVSGVVGIHFALSRGRGRNALPVRSVLLGSVLAVVLVTSTLTFGSGLNTLITHPTLYGWNWNYAISSTSDVPPQIVSTIERTPAIAASAGVDFIELRIDGVEVPSLADDVRSPALSPPILAGRTIRQKGEIVLGAETLAELHKRVGDTVTISYGSKSGYPVYIPPTKERVVGAATLPAVGYPSFIQDHPSMGTGAFLSQFDAPASFLKATENRDPEFNGPNIEFVRLKRGVSAVAGLAVVRRIAKDANALMARDPNEVGNDVTVLGAQHPAEIVNYRSIGATPLLLAGGLALGAIVALGITLVAAVRRRRRDLALLKTLGLTRRDLAATLAWQSSVTAMLAIVVGLPVGIALGRTLWTLFADSIYAVPEPTVPALSIVIVGFGALVFANAVAAIPGRLAARTPAGVVLRSE